MSHLLQPPTSVKLRLCPSSSPPSSTVEFAALLEQAGASWVTLHARHVSSGTQSTSCKQWQRSHAGGCTEERGRDQS
ncbi:hypothetical protein EV702DRAFT_1119009 [Suillus placidus]|uniref:DUS-like FMN-binding domain-containing protein n=1 Tax=Suillus placidus TaxID=48579 RepID=A0A9P7D1L5_9AGAM|nr:hypothetical protein EV702DRAFT_1119009 [Suillus placidus]